MTKDTRLVYSTAAGRAPKEKQVASAPKNDGIIRIRRETSGRKGKGVTTISGFTLPEAELRNLASRFKQLCGSGGSVKDFVIEIQGDHRDKLKTEIEKMGYTVKFAGG